MKKWILGALAFAAISSAALTPVAAVAEAAKNTAEDWTLTRTSIDYTKEGIELNQLEMGIPDNQAIAILEVPFDNTESFEIKFRVTMDDYVASGRNANDVWTGIGIMGVPKFINWRNSEQYGWAKDTPGLFTRFFSYDGDLRLESSVYHEGYRTAGEDPSSQTVDTWQLLNASAGVSLSKDVTLKLSYDTTDGERFYNLYVNGTKLSSSGQLAFIDRDVIFPDGKIYLVVAMNTQEKTSNTLSKVAIRSINGVDYTDSGAGSDSASENNSASQSGGREPAGCGSSIAAGGLAISAAVLVFCGFGFKRRLR